MKFYLFGLLFIFATLFFSTPVIAENNLLLPPRLSKALLYVNNVPQTVVEVAVAYQCNDRINIYRSTDKNIWKNLFSDYFTPISLYSRNRASQEVLCRPGTLVDYHMPGERIDEVYYRYSLYNSAEGVFVFSGTSFISNLFPGITR